MAEGLSFELMLVDWTFGTEELAGYSRMIRGVEKSPCLIMQEKDAARLGLKDHDRVRILQDGDSLEVELSVVRNMASGILILPRHRRLNWQIFKELPAKVSSGNIQKA